MRLRIFLGCPLLDHKKIVFLLGILIKSGMQTSALPSDLLDDGAKGLRKLFTFFRASLYADECDDQFNKSPFLLWMN